MNAADVYFAAEVDAITAERAAIKAAALQADLLAAARWRVRQWRREHTVECIDGEVCLLDMGAKKLRAALDAIEGG